MRPPYMGYGNNPNLDMANFLIKERPGKIEDLRENKFLFAQDARGPARNSLRPMKWSACVRAAVAVTAW